MRRRARHQPEVRAGTGERYATARMPVAVLAIPQISHDPGIDHPQGAITPTRRTHVTGSGRASPCPAGGAWNLTGWAIGAGERALARGRHVPAGESSGPACAGASGGDGAPSDRTNGRSRPNLSRAPVRAVASRASVLTDKPDQKIVLWQAASADHQGDHNIIPCGPVPADVRWP